MNKTKLLVTLGIFIAILLLFPFNKVFANINITQSNGTSYTLKNKEVGGAIELGGYNMNHPLWENKSLYCIEPDQGLNENASMKMTIEYYVEIVGNEITYKTGTVEKTENLNSSDISFYKGITTILSYANSRPDNNYIELDGKNIALWKYIDVYQDSKGIFKNNSKSYKMENGKLWREDSYYAKNVKQYENAYKIYNSAIEARKGREISKLVFYVLKGTGYSYQRMIVFEEGSMSPIELKVKIQKTDTSGNPIPGTSTSTQATFKITGSENVKSISGLTSSNTIHTVDTNGYTPVITITPNDPTKQVKIFVEETDSPDGYIKSENMTIIIQYYTDGNAYGVKPGYIRIMYKNDTSNCIANYSIGESGQETGIIKIKNDKSYPTKLSFEILKQNGINEDFLAGAEFDLYITNSSDNPLWKTSISPYTAETGSNGKFTVTITDATSIKKLCDAGDVRIYFKETKTPDNYSSIYAMNVYNRFVSCKIRGEEIVSKVSYKNDNYSIETNSNIYTIYNYPSLTFEFLKQDGKNKTPLQGAGFKFYITSESDPNTKLWASSTEYVTESNGKIVIKITDITMIKKLCNAENLKIWFLETTTPNGYTSIYSSDWNYRTCKVDGTKIVAINTFSNENYAITSGSNIYTIYNHRQIDIGGYVWLDGQTGIKPVNSPNGTIDEGEIGVKGVKVKLVNSSNELVDTTTTNAGGYYSFKINPGTYKILFTYEGINYERTINGESKATEIERSDFNDKFKTIPNNETLEYEADTEKGTSTLITGAEKIENSEGITALDMTNVQENFKMTATTAQTSYTQDTYNINFGLVRRGVDLSLATDVYSATVSINGKEKTYSDYNTNLAGIVLDPEREDRVIYNLNLYNSDYNYRLEDYFSEGLNDDIEEIDEAKNESPELNVDVTYAIYINNQSENTAYVNSIVDYFDTNYSFKDYKYVRYNSSGETEITGEILATIDGTAKINEITYNKITFSGLNVEDLKDGEQNILYVTFTVNKDENENVVTGDFKNIAEITSYSTDNGCVDKDSAPGNITTNFKEDDTDEAGGINIRIGGESRSITGYVWEDKDKNGKKDNNDETVSDVIVQLIELKDLTIGTDKYYFEYIWQETLSGSDTVYTIDRTEPNKIKEYKTEKAEGKYSFTGFIPGDYVIRFIYGDGTTTTYDMTGNMINYNGQDYKSTKDPAYNQEWYLESNYNDTESVARDNETRRLKVMSFSTLVDSEKGMLLKLLNNPEITDLSDTEKTILVSVYNKIYDPDITEFKDADKEKLLKEQVLENTWMNADTSKVNVPVDNNNTSGDNSLSYENMNFGLTLRPANKLTLEKHVSSMKIITTGIGTSSITDASIVDEKLQGLRKGLIADIATRTTRGFWKLETDIEELLQGATLEVTYNYTVKQDGDNDYLSQNLANAYKKICEKGKITWGGNDYTEYSQLLSDIASVNEPIGTYLSDAYYTGNTGTNTLSRVESIEDYYEHESKDLIFNEEKNTDFAITNKNDDGKIKPANENAYTISNGASSKTNSYTINKVIASVPTKVLNVESTDTKTVNVSKVLSSYNTEDDLKFDSNIAQIVAYSTATGRRDMESTPGNLDYIYSEDSDKGLNELDEFWAEPITITKSTGENKVATTTIVIIATTALAVIGIAAITIKKYVLIKKH